MLDNPRIDSLKKTSKLLGIPEAFIKKDYFVTQAIQILTHLDNEYYALVFQGETSLSKGYHLIHRLSEDVDFRVILKPAAKALGKEARRNKLRVFRYQLVDVLREAGFELPEQNIKVSYEGKYMHLQALYEESDKMMYLKPHIKIECFLGELFLPEKTLELTSLIQWTLPNESLSPHFSVNCAALDEITAEKWVALTRRVANTAIRQHAEDKHLVRHLYDLYYLDTSGKLTGNYSQLIRPIMEKDSQQFKNGNPAYISDPLKVSKLALDKLYDEKQWREHWNYFLEQMVYQKKELSFDAAYGQLLQLSQAIFNA